MLHARIGRSLEPHESGWQKNGDKRPMLLRSSIEACEM
jgi:hypothetical protein